MVKLNEALLVGISLLAALVLSKGRGSLSLDKILSDSSGNFLSYYKEIDKQQIQAIKKQESNIDTLENIKQTNLNLQDYNLDIASQILGYEKNLSQLEISKIENELGKTQSFISQQQKVPFGGPPIWLPNATGKALLSKFDAEFAYNPQGSLFPDINIPLNQSVRADFVRQANYEASQENIAKANELIFRQQGEIDRLQEEYQTRFGSLSRYG